VLEYELMFANCSPAPPETTPDADGALRALAAAVDEALAGDPAGWSDESLAVAMVEMRRQQARLAAAVVEATAAFDARRAWADDGSRGAADWIAARARLPRREVRADLRLGRRLRAMPATRAALRAGQIGQAHAHRLAGLAGNPRTAAAFAEGEALLVRNATAMRHDDFERTCDHWRDAADPDGPERRLARDHELRRVDLATGLDGVGHLDGYLTATGNAVVGGALERLEAELFRADWAEARARHGDAATLADLLRTPAQRRHDALVEMAERAMTAPAGGKRPRPLITVMVGYETFAGRVCELADGTVVAPGMLADLLGRDDTLIERVVFAGPNRITDISHARTFHGALRRALDVRDRRCGHPTCDVPAHRCEGDHVMAWSQGGLTTQENGQLRCGFHNRWRYRNPDVHPPPSRGRPPDDEAHPSWRIETDGERDVIRRLTVDLHAEARWRPIAVP
jgi:Domain of unknown function (DUF222)